MSDDIVFSTNSYRMESVDDAEFELSAGEVAAAFDVPAAKPLGRGSFGETWRLDRPDGTFAAAKVILSPTYSPARLAREVEGLSRVHHPNVVRLLETTSVGLTRGSRAALVFEFVPGGDAASRLRPGTRIDHGDVTSFGHGVLSGLEALHAADLVHRDVKPANIAVRDGNWGTPVLLDLGLARVLDQESITSYPSLMGTVPFMAPEQLRGERARKAADVFAVGVVMHLMLAGEHPFYGESETLTLLEAVTLIKAGPRRLPVDVPTDLADLVGRFLRPDEASRGSARRGRRDLEALTDLAALADEHDDSWGTT